MTALRIEGKVIGNLQDGKLIKSGKSVVLFRNFDGFALPDVPYELFGIKEVEVHYDKKIYSTTAQMFVENGIPFQAKGYEKQLVLPRRFWGVRDFNQTSLI